VERVRAPSKMVATEGTSEIEIFMDGCLAVPSNEVVGYLGIGLG